MSEVNSAYFFRPRLNRKLYLKGFEGYRTLVLGVFFVCENLSCPFREKCLEDSRPFNLTCPDCHDEELSDGNDIEIGCYINDKAKYPTYNSLTKYLLRCNLHPSVESKRKLWDSVAFTNYLQDFQNDYHTLSYDRDREKFLNDIPAFRAVLEELKPEVIYVIDDAVAECLMENFPELTFTGKCASWTLPIYRFTGRIESKDTPENIYASLRKEKVKISKILSQIEFLRGTDRLKEDKSPGLSALLLPHIWDKNFETFLLYNSILKRIGPEGMGILNYLLQGLFENEYTRSPQALDFVPGKLKQFESDGLVVEIIEKYADGVRDYDFIRYFGLSCDSESEWRFRKKEYTDYRKYLCASGGNGFTSSKYMLSDLIGILRLSSKK